MRKWFRFLISICILLPSSGANANSVALTSPDCENTSTGNASFRFYDVYAEDISSDSRGLLVQIAAPSTL